MTEIVGNPSARLFRRAFRERLASFQDSEKSRDVFAEKQTTRRLTRDPRHVRTRTRVQWYRVVPRAAFRLSSSPPRTAALRRRDSSWSRDVTRSRGIVLVPPSAGDIYRYGVSSRPSETPTETLRFFSQFFIHVSGVFNFIERSPVWLRRKFKKRRYKTLFLP